jgi:hypothetical protein
MSATHWLIVEERARAHRADLLTEHLRDVQARAALESQPREPRLMDSLHAAWGAVAGVCLLVGLQLVNGSLR